jgi:hypothetical protein
MSPRPARTVRGSLTKKGFREERSHHLYFRLHVDGEKTHVFTYISHGAQECDDHILGVMKKHLMLSRAQLDALIDCQMGGEEYVGILRGLGEIKA